MNSVYSYSDAIISRMILDMPMLPHEILGQVSSRPPVPTIVVPPSPEQAPIVPAFSPEQALHLAGDLEPNDNFLPRPVSPRFYDEQYLMPDGVQPVIGEDVMDDLMYQNRSTAASRAADRALSRPLLPRHDQYPPAPRPQLSLLLPNGDPSEISATDGYQSTAISVASQTLELRPNLSPVRSSLMATEHRAEPQVTNVLSVVVKNVLDGEEQVDFPEEPTVISAQPTESQGVPVQSPVFREQVAVLDPRKPVPAPVISINIPQTRGYIRRFTAEPQTQEIPDPIDHLYEMPPEPPRPEPLSTVPVQMPPPPQLPLEPPQQSQPSPPTQPPECRFSKEADELSEIEHECARIDICAPDYSESSFSLPPLTMSLTGNVRPNPEQVLEAATIATRPVTPRKTLDIPHLLQIVAERGVRPDLRVEVEVPQATTPNSLLKAARLGTGVANALLRGALRAALEAGASKRDFDVAQAVPLRDNLDDVLDQLQELGVRLPDARRPRPALPQNLLEASNLTHTMGIAETRWHEQL